MQRKLLIIESLYSETEAQEHVNREMEHVRGLLTVSNKLWKIVKVTLTFSILIYWLLLNFNKLREIGDRMVIRLVLGAWAKDCGMDKYRQLELYPYLFKAGYKYSSLDWFYTV